MKSKSGRRAAKVSAAKVSKANNSTREMMAGPLTDTIERSRDVILNGLKTLQDETMRLVDRRFERNSELLRECQSCRNIVDLMAVQQRWLTSIGLDYYQGGMRLGRVVQEIMSEEVMELGEASEAMEHAAHQQEHAAA
jgi:hypothetical protein